MATPPPDRKLRPSRPGDVDAAGPAGATPAPPLLLDPRELGRPVHLLPAFTALWRDDFAAVLRNGPNRRYRAAYDVGDVTLNRVDEPAGGGRWYTYFCAAGEISFSMERPLLLSILDFRYGGRPAAKRPAPLPPSDDTIALAELMGGLTPDPEGRPAPGQEPEQGPAQEHGPVAPPPVAGAAAAGSATVSAVPERETATEERLAESLGLQWVTALGACVDAVAPARPGAVQRAQVHHFSPVTASPPGLGRWTLGVSVQEPTLAAPAQIWFALDEGWMRRLLHNLTPARDKPREPRSPAVPLAAQLEITLIARMLRRETSLGQLVDLAVGDVIPIRLGPTEVLVDDTALFTGALAEHQGRLCLTSFKDVD